jgi:hypothetical protein
MKWAILFWAAPVAFLTGWYGLSYHDVNFGYFMLSRDAHDLVFEIYGQVLGMPAEDVPPLVFKAIVFDTLLVFALIPLWRYRKVVFSFVKEKMFGQRTVAPVQNDESLSSAP